MTTVYAIPHSNLRSVLWNNLYRLSASISEPWCVLGDFNDIQSANERIGGQNDNFNHMQWFQRQINDCGLTDMGSIGPKMTWRGPRLSRCFRLYERLDRALVNDEFLHLLPNSFVKVLPRTEFSDHNSLLLSIGKTQVAPKSARPFRFEAMWLTHESFHEFLQSNWTCQDFLLENLINLKGNISEWNRDVFGLVEKKKKNLLARLNGIQKSLAYPHSRFLCELELKLQFKLEEVLRDEELKWFQKFRANWISRGDRNMRYYHLQTNCRRRKNKVLALKNENGQWIEEEEVIKNMIITFFKNLFQDESNSPELLLTNTNYPELNSAILTKLGDVPSDEEIKSEIFANDHINNHKRLLWLITIPFKTLLILL